MSDREEIYDLMVRYGRATDTHDIELARTCFAADVSAQYEPFGRPLEDYDALMTSWIEGLEPIQTSHHFSNFTYEIDGNDGSYSCLLIAQHWPRGTEAFGDTPMYIVGARYDNRVRRTPEGWRITRLHLRTLWGSGDPDVLGHLGS